MSDLKYLEEVLPAYRAGKTLTCYNGGRHYIAPYGTKWADYSIEDYPLGSLALHTWMFVEKCWEIKPQYVSWPEAWEALKAEKRIFDPETKTSYRLYKYQGKPVIMGSKDALNDGEAVGATNKEGIPIYWMDKADFEIMED